MRNWFALGVAGAFALVAGCSSSGGGGSGTGGVDGGGATGGTGTGGAGTGATGGTGAASGGAAGTGTSGAAGAGGTLGSFSCGGMPCEGANSYCEGTNGGAGNTSYETCIPIPASCNGMPSCDCLTSAQCSCSFKDAGYYVHCNSNAGAGGS